MAGSNTFKCGSCGGNLWPDTATYRDHVHLAEPDLKKKYTQGYTGRKGGAPSRSNSKGPDVRTLKPRRRAYGPW